LQASFFLFFLLAIVFTSSSAWAQRGLPQARIQGVALGADNMDRDAVNDSIELSGNVQIIYQDQHLSCDRARVNFRAKTIDAIGNVIVTTPLATINGNRVIMDYESNTGLILDGFVKSGTVLFEGTQIHKMSETEYIADDARYTTCTTCPEAWSFSGSRIRAEIGGYAYIKNSFLRAAGIPIFWLPYLAVPLKSDRQSGLLTPGLESSGTGGLMISLPYFWAIDRSRDLTWTVQHFEKRGWKNLFSYRYVLNENSKGYLDFGHLTDKVFSNDGRLNNFRPENNKGSLIERWFAKYHHYYAMPQGFIHRAQINGASDLQYPKDFPLETTIHGDSSMESRMSLTKNTASQHYSADASIYRNLLQSNPLAGSEDSVNRLPEIKFSQTQTKIGESDFLYSIDLNYVNFARSGFAYDDIRNAEPAKQISNAGPSPKCGTGNWEQDPNCKPIRDGQFDEGTDLIRTGQRLDFRPTLYRPFKLKNLDILPTLSFRETDYTFPVGRESNQSRRYFRAEISARTTLSRIYGDFSSLQSERIKHEIQPTFTGTSIPWIDQKKSSFFSNSANEDITFFNQASINDGDLNGDPGIQFDYNDRVYDRKRFTAALVNKFTRKSWEGGSPVYLQFVYWKLSQSYDAHQAERDPKSEFISDLASEFRISFDRFQVSQQANYYPYQQVANTSSRFLVSLGSSDWAQIEHILNYAISPRQEARDSLRSEDYSLTLKKGGKWIDLVGKFTYDVTTPRSSESRVDLDQFKSWGYGAQLKVPGDCLFFSVVSYRVTGGDTNFRLNVNFIWDGQTSPPISESLLATFGF
jgi:LPS-assembly protein